MEVGRYYDWSRHLHCLMQYDYRGTPREIVKGDNVAEFSADNNVMFPVHTYIVIRHCACLDPYCDKPIYFNTCKGLPICVVLSMMYIISPVIHVYTVSSAAISDINSRH